MMLGKASFSAYNVAIPKISFVVRIFNKALSLADVGVATAVPLKITPMLFLDSIGEKMTSPDWKSEIISVSSVKYLFRFCASQQLNIG